MHTIALLAAAAASHVVLLSHPNIQIKPFGRIAATCTLKKLEALADTRFYIMFDPQLEWPHISTVDLSLRG
jgi:hypothetical protein